MADSISQQLISLVRNYLAIVGNIFDLALLEVKLAGQSLKALCILIGCIFILLFGTWLSLLGLLFVILLSLGLKPIWVFLTMTLVHIVLMGLVLYLMNTYRQNLSFKATRRQLSLKMEKTNESA